MPNITEFFSEVTQKKMAKGQAAMASHFILLVRRTYRARNSETYRVATLKRCLSAEGILNDI
jgi:hypothetical protein